MANIFLLALLVICSHFEMGFSTESTSNPEKKKKFVMIGLFGGWVRGNLDVGTWSSRPLGLGKLRWIAVDGARVWLGADAGLFVSEDDGQSFVARQPEGFFTPKPLFLEGAVVGAPGGELARSTDDGRTWTPVFPTERGFGAVALARGTGDFAQRIVVVGIYGRIAVSDDSGRTFTMVREGNDEAFNHVCIDGSDVWIVGSTRVLHATIAQPGAVTEVGPKRDRNAQYGTVSAAHETIWITNALNVLRSRDRGASWEVIVEKPIVFKAALISGPRRVLALTAENVAWLVEG